MLLLLSAATQCPSTFFACPNIPTCLSVADGILAVLRLSCGNSDAKLAILDSAEKMEGCLIPYLSNIGT